MRLRGRTRKLGLAGLLVFGVLAAMFVMPGRRHTHSDGAHSHAHPHPHHHHHDDSPAAVASGQSHTHIRFLWWEFSVSDSASLSEPVDGVSNADEVAVHPVLPHAWMQWLQVLVMLVGLWGHRKVTCPSLISSALLSRFSSKLGRLRDRPVLPPPRWI